MTHQTFCNCMEQILLRFREKMSEDTIKLYWQDLRHVPDDDMVEATRVLTQQYEYLPRNLTAFVLKTTAKNEPFQGSFRPPEPIPDEDRLTREEIHQMFADENKKEEETEFINCFGRGRKMPEIARHEEESPFKIMKLKDLRLSEIQCLCNQNRCRSGPCEYWDDYHECCYFLRALIPRQWRMEMPQKIVEQLHRTPEKMQSRILENRISCHVTDIERLEAESTAFEEINIPEGSR